MWWTGQTSQKYILPHLPNAIPPPPDEHALYKDNFATINGKLSKVVADIAVRGPYVAKPTNIALEAVARPTQDGCSIVVR